jgi:enoyl-CoA hydratase/carnithine racemase
MMMEKVRVQHHDRVVHVVLADAQRGNALDSQTVGELLGAVRNGRERAEILVLQSDGAVFSRGRPQPHPSSPDHTVLEQVRVNLTLLRELNHEIRQWPGVSIAAVQGGAWGAGTGLLVQCDVVLSEPDARFAFPEMMRDLPPALVVAYLPRWINPKAAHYLALTGQEISAEHALSWGLVSEIVPKGTLPQRLGVLVDILAARKPGGCAPAKKRFCSIERWRRTMRAAGGSIESSAG